MPTYQDPTEIDRVDPPETLSVETSPAKPRKRAARARAKPRAGSGTTFGAVKLADILLPHLKDRFRYCPELGWLEWTDAKWARVSDDRPLHILVNVLKQHTRDVVDAVGLLDRDSARELATFSSGSTQGHALKIARANPAVAAAVDEFDRQPDPGQPYRFHAANGWTINMHRGGDVQVRPTVPADMNTKVGCAYDPEATAPITTEWWPKYQPSVDVRRWVLEEAARGLAGIGGERFTVWWGASGGNGKGTMESLFQAIAGEYSVKLPVEIILASSRSARETFRNELAMLRGARFAWADEPEEGSRLKVAEINRLTGGSEITARENYLRPVTFTPRVIFTMICNDRPSFYSGGGIDRRYVELGWDYEISKDAIVEDFKTRVAREAPGVLNQVLKCWRGDYPATPPDAVREQTERAKRDANPIARFAAEALAESAGDESARMLYAAYRMWCERNGEWPKKGKTFGGQLAKLGFESKHSRTGTVYVGVSVDPDHQPTERYMQL